MCHYILYSALANWQLAQSQSYPPSIHQQSMYVSIFIYYFYFNLSLSLTHNNNLSFFLLCRPVRSIFIRSRQNSK